MLQKDNRYKILRIFFEDPSPKGIGFQLREISRKVAIATTSVKKYLNELEEEELVIKTKHRIYGYPVYYANRDNENFKFLKRLDTIIRIKESGLLDHLAETCMPDVIVLFGSASQGEDLKESDIDLFVMSKEEKLDIDKFEKILNRKINIFFSENFNKLSEELRNNIINGVILKGYLRVF
jgi:predicted nucleotidyltransferase